MPGSFFDTNVLVYIASGDSVKADQAEMAIAAGGAISVQVLNELSIVARRKMRLSWMETHTFLATLRGLLTVHPITIETHEAGLALAERYSFSIYDAMIAAAALHAGCDTLWSEDMQHGMALDEGLRIANPFRPSA
ncbi:MULTISPECIES: PIN domain-containing protein [unclassified Mesorhizobium]|uniref:PIN domain-containing protein n=1 Tax=unclassified Mesorhizobium TaxID=325217 RepID=UPI0007EC5EB3|nr:MULTISPECIES: PIN domain-containing protein [unclassified Mesorhizobium]RWB24835.1 MAG: PIN domain-containing protein [Mesorhizobium sp.]RWC22657.1 MAG: PIN domain-containing protein [Mesorhizobium sp.]RWD39006.1 MAG: PIN domain-containing protein [Mesorhizobium sp.]RWD45844.1 MAG: PIN domain-containing protein [Mesorhizobium sp.]RWD81624.1 MAG: PIN domain-containing protein [Mesorhizobium sp.]